MSKSAVLKHNIGFLSHLPVGSIVAWHRDFENTPALPPGWAECNGQTLEDPDSPYHGKSIPNLNGQGRFLRGAECSGETQPQDWKSFTVAGHARGPYTHSDVLIPKEGYNTTYPFGGEWAAVLEGGVNVANQLRFKFDDSEVRPINMSVVWIMKVKQVTASYPTQALQAEEQTPPGAIYVSRAGNVGIGTPSPGAKLEVAGTVKASAFQGDGSGLTGINGRWSDGPSGAIYFNNGSVGIGTATPTWPLHVKSGPNYGGLLLESEAWPELLFKKVAGKSWRIGHDGDDFHLRVWQGSSLGYRDRIVATYGGNVGIGTTSPERKLDVAGNVQAEGIHLSGGAGGIWDGSAHWRIYAYGNIYLNGGTYQGSDIHWKKNITQIDKALDKVLSLRGVYYEWRTDEYPDKLFDKGVQVGIIAQDVEKVMPELIQEVDGGYKTLEYGKLTALLIEAIKEQQNIINEQISNTGGFRLRGNDYAEYFASLDSMEIPVGISVVLEGDKIRTAKKDELPIGVISASHGIVGGVYPEWPEKYLRDDFGNVIMEKYQEEVMAPQKEKVKRERQKMEKKTIEEEVTRVEVMKKGKKYIQQEITETVTRKVEEPVFKEVNLYDTAGKKVIGRHKVPVMETYEEEIEVLDDAGNPVMEGTGEFVTKQRPKLNPDYDESKEYVPREERPEWNCVGLLGQLPLRKGQPVAPTWVKIKDISEEVELWLAK